MAGDDITLNMRDCIITENFASQNGGGIHADAAILRDCTISENSADAGGGIYLLTSENVLLNCTISGNEATNGDEAHLKETISGSLFGFLKSVFINAQCRK